MRAFAFRLACQLAGILEYALETTIEVALFLAPDCTEED